MTRKIFNLYGLVAICLFSVSICSLGYKIFVLQDFETIGGRFTETEDGTYEIVFVHNNVIYKDYAAEKSQDAAYGSFKELTGAEPTQAFFDYLELESIE